MKRSEAIYRLRELQTTISTLSTKEIEEYRAIDKILKDTFVRTIYNPGDKVELVDNRCNAACGCFYDPQRIEKYKIYEGLILDHSKTYTIKKLNYFGGGCPSVLLELEELPTTHTHETSLPANWFRVIKE